MFVSKQAFRRIHAPVGEAPRVSLSRYTDIFSAAPQPFAAWARDTLKFLAGRTSAAMTRPASLIDCSGRAGIQAGAKRDRHALRLAFQYSRRHFHGFVGDFVSEDIVFNTEVHDALIHTLVLHVKVMFLKRRFVAISVNDPEAAHGSVPDRRSTRELDPVYWLPGL
jgi:hypothetical protein